MSSRPVASDGDAKLEAKLNEAGANEEHALELALVGYFHVGVASFIASPGVYLLCTSVEDRSVYKMIGSGVLLSLAAILGVSGSRKIFHGGFSAE